MQSSFHEISRSKYIAEVKADDDVVSVSVPQNVTGDVAGNKNLASNILQVRRRKKFHFSLYTLCFLLLCNVYVLQVISLDLFGCLLIYTLKYIFRFCANNIIRNLCFCNCLFPCYLSCRWATHSVNC